MESAAEGLAHIGSRRRPLNKPQYSAEEQALDQIAKEAEARLAARRQARAEAREIRMRELEKQQKENDESLDRQFDSSPLNLNQNQNRAGSLSYQSSRRSSEDSSEDGLVSMRELKHELRELEDKFRKSMVQNAQLDNEKSTLGYEVELLKDRIEDLEEAAALLGKEHREKCRELESCKRLSNQLKEERDSLRAQLLHTSQLIQDYGLVILEEEVEVRLEDGSTQRRFQPVLRPKESSEGAEGTGGSSEERNELLEEIKALKAQLEEERCSHFHGSQNGGLDSESETETGKQLADYRFKVQKYEQEMANLSANVTRLETQLGRYKTAAEEAEAREDDLKVERRKLQRELREAQSKLDELETANSHLQKRLDKLKTAKSTLLKEL